jgi:hypothetical protein
MMKNAAPRLTSQMNALPPRRDGLVMGKAGTAGVTDATAGISGAAEIAGAIGNAAATGTTTRGTAGSSICHWRILSARKVRSSPRRKHHPRRYEKPFLPWIHPTTRTRLCDTSPESFL